MRNFELFVPRSPRYYVNTLVFLLVLSLPFFSTIFYSEHDIQKENEAVVFQTAYSDLDIEISHIQSITAPAYVLNDIDTHKLTEPITIPKFDEKDVSEAFTSQLVSDYPTVSSNKTYKSIIKDNATELKNIIPTDYKKKNADEKNADKKSEKIASALPDKINAADEADADIEAVIKSNTNDIKDMLKVNNVNSSVSTNTLNSNCTVVSVSGNNIDIQANNITDNVISVNGIKVDDVPVDNISDNAISVNNIKVDDIQVNNISDNAISVNDIKIDDIQVNNISDNAISVNDIKVDDVQIKNIIINNISVNGNASIESTEFIDAASPDIKAVLYNNKPSVSIKPAMTTPITTTAKSEQTEEPIDKEKYSGGKYPYEDVYLLAQLIRGEAAYEGRRGMIAVAEVVINRVNHESFPNTVSDVIFSPGQFAGRSSIKRRKPTEEMISVAYDVLNRGIRIFNKPDVVYFRNPKITSNISPYKMVDWGDKPYYRGVGSHAFYLQKR